MRIVLVCVAVLCFAMKSHAEGCKYWTQDTMGCYTDDDTELACDTGSHEAGGIDWPNCVRHDWYEIGAQGGSHWDEYHTFWPTQYYNNETWPAGAPNSHPEWENPNWWTGIVGDHTHSTWYHCATTGSCRMNDAFDACIKTPNEETQYGSHAEQEDTDGQSCYLPTPSGPAWLPEPLFPIDPPPAGDNCGCDTNDPYYELCVDMCPGGGDPGGGDPGGGDPGDGDPGGGDPGTGDCGCDPTDYDCLYECEMNDSGGGSDPGDGGGGCDCGCDCDDYDCLDACWYGY